MVAEASVMLAVCVVASALEGASADTGESVVAVYDYKVKCANPQVIHKVNELTGHYDRYVVPCGKCLLCRMRQRREIALRCMLERRCSYLSYFVTLTYMDEPDDLDYRDIQLFVKRLRKTGLKFKYLFCSDVGEKRGRKHWHGLIFVPNYADVVGSDIERHWKNGFCDVRLCNDARVGYATGYVLKKVMTDNDVVCHYSQRLGLSWLYRNLEKVEEDCCIWFAGKRYAIPRYFRHKIIQICPEWIDYYHSRLSDDLVCDDDIDFGVYVDSMRAEEQAKKIEYALKKGKGVL